MKTNKPAILALVLWLLFVASNAFAVFKSPYPLKAYLPDQTTIVANDQGNIADGNGNYGVSDASQRR
jgi:hypothetical protein